MKWNLISVALILAVAQLSDAKPKPWVVLDSRSDMLAMSSEISEDLAPVEAIAPPPTTTLEPESQNDETAGAASTTASVLSADEPEVTTELPPLSILLDDEVVQVQTTENPVEDENENNNKHNDEAQEETVDVTTTLSSIAPPVDADKGELTPEVKTKSNEEDENVGIRLFSSDPSPMQNPNSIEGDADPAVVIAIRKKLDGLHGFLKKTASKIVPK